MKKLFNKIFYRFISLEAIQDRLNQVKINRCIASVEKHDSARFYEEAVVHNIQNDKSKIKIGSNTHIRGELMVFLYGGKIEIGENCFIGEGTKIWSGEHIIIGNNVGISHNINIMDFAHESNHLKRAEGVISIFKNGHPKDKGVILTSPIIIEDYVAIYPNSSILRGVRIGKGSIISTGSVVMNDVPPFSLIMGNPGRVMGKTN